MRFWYNAATAPRPFPAGCGSRWAGRSPSTSPSRCGPSRRGSRAPCTTRTAACSAAASSPNSRPLQPLLSPQPPETGPCAPSRPHRGGPGYVPICTGCARPAAKRPHPGGVACQHVTALFYRTSRSPPRCSLPLAATTRSNRRNDPAVVPGAPSNGVRFILYALDLAGQPIATQPIGYADLMDESSGNTQTLHVLVVGTTTDPPVTYLDYAVSVTLGAGTATVAVVGFITDGIERLDFNAAIGETTGSTTFDIRFDVNAADAHVRLRMTLTAPDQNTLRLAINFRLQFGSEVVTVTGSQTLDLTTLSESATLTVLVDGGIYATITETDGSNTFAGGGGQELTADDLTALGAIFDAIATTFQQFDALFAPAGSLGA